VYVDVKIKIVPTVVTGATGTVCKSFRKYLNSITEKYKKETAKKTALLLTATCFREV